MKRLRILSVLIVPITMLSLCTATASASPTYKNIDSVGQYGVCVDANSNNYGAGDNIIAWGCNTHAEQEWTERASAAEPAAWEFVNKDGYCLTAAGDYNLASLTLQNCTDASTQIWWNTSTSNNMYLFDYSSYCMDANSNTWSANNTKMQVYKCNTSDEQAWWWGSE